MIEPWTTQIVENISVTIFEHDVTDDEDFEDGETVYYTAEIALFLRDFDDLVSENQDDIKEKVLILATDLNGPDYTELAFVTVSAVSMLYPDTYIVPVIYVLGLNADGTDKEIDIVDLSYEMYPEEGTDDKQPLMRM